MNEFIQTHHSDLISTAISIASFFLLRFIIASTIRRIARSSGMNKVRASLVIKYVSFVLMLILIAVLVFIWRVDLKELTIVFSSVFAVMGIALFASWSILSNVTAGVILFFAFPFKVGDRIRILDSDLSEDVDIIDIKAYHVYLKTRKGALITYPNSLMLSKGVALIQKETDGSYATKKKKKKKKKKIIED